MKYMVVREGMWLLAIGLVLTLAVGRAAAAFLYGLTARDPQTLTLASATLAAVALGSHAHPRS